MKPRQYAEHLRNRGYSFEAIRVFVSLVYGKPIDIKTILNWLSPKRRKIWNNYMREWMRKHRAAGKKPGKPIVDRNRFDIQGPFE